MRSIIEVHTDAGWVPAAEFTPMGGGRSATFEYLIEYVFGSNPLPVSLTLPVTAERQGVGLDGEPPPCPAFLLDLVPQGRGRTYLAQELHLADGDDKDLLLAQYGAFNPIGNLRLDTAVQFYEKHRTAHPDGGHEGFALKDILARQEAFLDHIWLHAMLSAGTTGVQGAAPKFLLTQDHSGQWFADSALPDEAAAAHWLVKLPRGKHETDYAVLRNEAAYMRVAERCGLRVAGEPMFEQDMLFLPRFDRVVAGGRVQRLHQESLASLASMRGFGLRISLFELVEAFNRHVTHPAAEIAEFMKRDVLNLAMRNTDNHARNTAVQRLADGTVQLTPLFDFAPMYLDRELIVRGCKWAVNNGRELTEWDDILETLNTDEADKPEIARELREFAEVLQDLPQLMQDCGVDRDIIEHCMPAIETQHARLEAMRGYGPTP